MSTKKHESRSRVMAGSPLKKTHRCTEPFTSWIRAGCFSSRVFFGTSRASHGHESSNESSPKKNTSVNRALSLLDLCWLFFQPSILWYESSRVTIIRGPSAGQDLKKMSTSPCPLLLLSHICYYYFYSPLTKL